MGNRPACDKFLPCILQNGLSQIVHQGTSGTAHFDLILTADSQLVSDVLLLLFHSLHLATMSNGTFYYFSASLSALAHTGILLV